MDSKRNMNLGAQTEPRRIFEIQQKMLEREATYLSFGYDVEKERGHILDVAEPLRGEILEAGTGKGYFSVSLAKRGYRFTTFDISREEQEIARLHLQQYRLDPYARFVIENGESLSFENESFETIFSVNTLHHLENPLKVIDQLMRVLALLGKLVLCDFTDKGFEMMRKIHEAEGNVHTAGKLRLSEAATYLSGRGYEIRKECTVFQETLIATKQI